MYFNVSSIPTHNLCLKNNNKKKNIVRIIAATSKYNCPTTTMLLAEHTKRIMAINVLYTHIYIEILD